MKAKFEVKEVTENEDGSENLSMRAVSEQPFDAEGVSDDNSFARYTPSGELTMLVNNPNLKGKIVVGEKYYLTFEKADK